MPGDAVTPNAGPRLLLNCYVKVQNIYQIHPSHGKNGFLN